MTCSTALDTQPRRPEIQPDLQDVAHQVREEFADRIDPRQVDECLGRVAARFDDAKIRSFVPLLVRRYAREELRACPEHA